MVPEMRQKELPGEPNMGSSRFANAKEVCDLVRRSRYSDLPCKDVLPVSQQHDASATPRIRDHRERQCLENSCHQRDPRKSRSSTMKRNSIRMNASFGSIDELEPVQYFFDSMSSLTSFSQHTGPNHEVELSLCCAYAIAQGPLLFESTDAEKRRDLAPKMPQRSGTTEHCNDVLDYGNNSMGSLNLDDIMEDTSGHTCDTTKTKGRVWSDASPSRPVRTDSF